MAWFYLWLLEMESKSFFAKTNLNCYMCRGSSFLLNMVLIKDFKKVLRKDSSYIDVKNRRFEE